MYTWRKRHSRDIFDPVLNGVEKPSQSRCAETNLKIVVVFFMILFFLRLKTKLKCFQQNVVIRRFQATYSILQKVLNLIKMLETHRNSLVFCIKYVFPILSFINFHKMSIDKNFFFRSQETTRAIYWLMLNHS